MDEDARSFQREQMVARAISESACGKRWTPTLVFGALVGMAVGVLNLVAVANEWELKYAFEAPDDPIMRFMGAAQDRAFVEMPSVLVIIGYWTLIGVLLALVFCFVRVARMRKGAAESGVSGE